MESRNGIAKVTSLVKVFDKPWAVFDKPWAVFDKPWAVFDKPWAVFDIGQYDFV